MSSSYVFIVFSLLLHYSHWFSWLTGFSQVLFSRKIHGIMIPELLCIEEFFAFTTGWEKSLRSHWLCDIELAWRSWTLEDDGFCGLNFSKMIQCCSFCIKFFWNMMCSLYL